MRPNPLSDDSASISALEQSLAQLSEEEEDLKEDEKRIHARMDVLRGQKLVLQQAVLVLRQRTGLQSSPEAAGSIESGKGEIFQRFAMQRAAEGFTISEVFRLFRDQEVEIGKNYPYFLVDIRYKKSLRKVGGTRLGKRYYWTGTTGE
jgi:hypothetical protein